ncbi:hypothetical protein C0J52_27780 [Blattella germanica]|nr:hypothetical protein C0J52_27780 [Blattella germanica]
MYVLEINPGYDSLNTVSQIVSEEIRDTPKGIPPNHILLLKYAPVTPLKLRGCMNKFGTH